MIATRGMSEGVFVEAFREKVKSLSAQHSSAGKIRYLGAGKRQGATTRAT